MFVEPGVHEVVLADGEFGQRSGEVKSFESLECRRRTSQGHVDLDRKAGCRRPRQPVCGDVHRNPLSAADRSVSQSGVYLQPVRLYAFYPEGFAEGCTSDLEPCVPGTRRVIDLRRKVEYVHTVPGAAVYLLGIELAFRGIDFHYGRMVIRDPVVLVLEDHRHVQGVSRSPDAPFSVDESLESLLKFLPSDIETAQ